MNRIKIYRISIVLLSALVAWAVTAGTQSGVFNHTPVNLTAFAVLDTIETQEPVGKLPYPIKDFSGNPYLENEEGGAIDLALPDNLEYHTQYDAKTNQVTIYRRIGGIDVRLPYTMTLEEYMSIETRNSIMSYWKTRQQQESSRQADRQFHLGGDLLDGIFGNNLIDIRLQGMAELKVGITRTKIDNPTLQERLRKTTTFDFQENIQMNITGNIGDKMKLGINYNTEALFDFENQVKLEYTGKEDEIIKKIEAGNVTLPLPGTLITGSQSLFGIKTEMQFGKLSVTSIFSQQKGQSSVINLEGGAQTQEFEVPIDQYDRNRHFFLTHFFRDQYNNALATLPIINSPFNITKIEVWVTNRSGNFDQSRNILGFMDLAETGANISNTILWMGQPGAVPSNEANTLYQSMTSTYSAVRDINKVTATFAPLASSSFIGGEDFEKIENARLLSPTEYTLNSKLGYISLNTSLQADEVLAIAFEYTYRGQVYKVGEFAASGIDAPNTLFLKLIKGTALTPEIKTWNLMMKNIYSIGAYQINPDDFRLDVVYVNDSTGSEMNYFPEGEKKPNGINGELLLRVMNLDSLNSRQEPGADGRFDFVDGYTVYPQNGRIIFPVLEPFGSHLATKLQGQPNSAALINKYVFQALYDSTQTIAGQTAEKNKFKLKGSYKSSSSSDISLNAMNIPQGSVVVTAGGIKLAENTDYTVDYTLGRIKIINQGLLESGTPIQVSLESQSLFNLQTKTLLGTHFDYRFNDKFNIGATIMHLNERPMTQKVNIGDEPISNTIWGLNGSYSTKSMGITNLLDKLPLVQTKEESSITIEGEFAHLIPGHPKVISRDGAAYIDDFEGTKISYDLKNWTSWKFASTPQGQPGLFPEAEFINDLRYGFNRSKLAWYVIDPLFLRNSSYTPGHIKDDVNQQSNHFVREVFQSEIFPYKESGYGQPTNIPVLNLAYYPRERGPYNFDTDVDPNGFLNNPMKRWGGIMRKVETNDFEAANIEYIEFWMMDPFVYNQMSATGGELYFNIGNISEDILRDSRKSFEQGLPVPGEISGVDTTAWGLVARKQSLVNAFSNDPAARRAQDVGLDGLSSVQEASFFNSATNPFVNIISTIITNQEALERLKNDPASDDYHYYRGSDFDQAKTSILDRYKHFNSPEGNSVASEYSPEPYSTAATSIPDGEDINMDNTLSETENYFQYKVELSPEKMVVGQNYITDMIEPLVTLKNGKKENIRWYQFKIPISAPDTTIGNIKDFRSIRFMRMFMTNFNDTTILRFATLDLVRGDWRKYNVPLPEPGDNVNPNPNTLFEVAAVNIEENGARKPVNYILPPGINRMVDPSNPQLQKLNEQSITLKAIDLAGRDSRAVYKNVNMDFRQYKKIKMEVHAEEIEGYPLSNNEVSAFIRIGTDYRNNYYEYEIPLKLTPYGTYAVNNNADRLTVWPEENRFDIDLDKFQQIKLRRNDEKRKEGSTTTFNDVYVWNDPDRPNNYIRIKGNPNLGNVKTIMIGIKVRGHQMKSVEVWMNELRLTDFDEKGGWAANARMSVKLADLGNLSVAGKTTTAGFGSIDQSVTERKQEDFYQYDIATNLEVGKFLGPENRVSIPFYFGYSQSVASPRYYPLDPDIPLSVALENAESKAARDSIRELSQAVVDRKSINFTNVRLTPKNDQKITLISPTNLSATYSFNETSRRDMNTDYAVDKNHRGMLAYNYNGRPNAIEPFKKTKVLNNKAFALIKDFNIYLLPTQLSYRWEMVRQYNEEQLRNISNPDYRIPVTVRKDFDWNRYFDLNYNLTKALRIDFKAITNSRIDEPEGAVNRRLYPDEYQEWKDSVLHNILNFGRVTSYTHNTNVSYNIPINKFPMLDWTTATLRYGSMYQWGMGPVAREQYNWGNIIKNSNSMQGSGQFNFTNLYNKVPYLKELNRKYGTAQRGNQQQARTLRFNKENVELKTAKPVEVNHRLKSENITLRAFDKNGRPIQGETKVINGNKAQFIPQSDHESARIMVTATAEENNSALSLIKDYSALMLTSVKNLSVSYGENNGTMLPGYLPGTNFMGMSSFNGFTAPGIPFILGWQDRNFAYHAVDKGWITNDESLNSPYTMTSSNDFNIKATIEPIKGLRLDVTADRRFQKNMNENYIFEDGSFKGAFNTMENGNFNMSYNLIRTAFNKVGKSGIYESETYQDFLSYRQTIANRLAKSRNGYIDPKTGLPYDPSANGTLEKGTNGYGLNSQEVLIPAFLAAYSGKNPDKQFLELFPSLLYIQPNWRLSYDGLSRIKLFSKWIKSFDITHAYSSTYSIGSFLTNLDFERMADGLSWMRDASNSFIAPYQVNSVTLSEQFSPLIQFNITWVNSLSTRAEIKKSRVLNLSLSNNQLIETYSDELVFGLGYRIDKLNLNIGNRSFSSDVNLRGDLSIRDNLSIIRKIEEQVDQLTSGQRVISLKMTADYALSDRFNLQLFYDRTVNNPYISLSYPTTNANFGVSFRFTLSQ